jgi:hypothetical protein
MTKTDYNIGDINSKEKGSGARANSGKISFAITPLPLLAGCARVWMYGLLKYAPWNWAKGMQWSIPFDCLCRHLFKWWYLGEDIDPESGEHHLDLVFCNLFMLKHYTKTFQEGDDRPPEYADFAPWLEDFNAPFDEAAFLERNPDIAELVAKRRAEEAGVMTQAEINEACDRQAKELREEETKEPIDKLIIRLYGESLDKRPTFDKQTTQEDTRESLVRKHYREIHHCEVTRKVDKGEKEFTQGELDRMLAEAKKLADEEMDTNA